MQMVVEMADWTAVRLAVTSAASSAAQKVA